MASSNEIPFKYDVGDRVQTTNGRPGTVSNRYRDSMGISRTVVALDAWKGYGATTGQHYDEVCLDPLDLTITLTGDVARAYLGPLPGGDGTKWPSQDIEDRILAEAKVREAINAQLPEDERRVL